MFFQWLLDTVREQEVDYLIVSGDIFDSPLPSNQSFHLYYRFLAQLPSYGACGAVIVGGNHDSPSSLAAPRELLEALRIFVRGAVSKDPEDDVVLLEGRGGEGVLCGLVPYLRERDIRVSRAGESPEERHAGIVRGIAEHYRRIGEAIQRRRSPDITGAIATGHLFTAGTTGESESERELYVGKLGIVDSEVFPSDIDYLALGHIHSPWVIAPHIRYAGSPIPMDFGEEREKSVYLVDIPGEVRKLRIPEFRRLLRFHADPKEVREEIRGLSREELGESGLSPWAEIRLKDTAPGIFASFEELLEEKGISLLRVMIDRVEGDSDTLVGTESLQDISAQDMFRLRCKAAGVSPDDRLLLAFDELLQGVLDRRQEAPQGLGTESEED